MTQSEVLAQRRSDLDIGEFGRPYRFIDEIVREPSPHRCGEEESRVLASGETDDVALCGMRQRRSQRVGDVELHDLGQVADGEGPEVVIGFHDERVPPLPGRNAS